MNAQQANAGDVDLVRHGDVEAKRRNVSRTKIQEFV